MLKQSQNLNTPLTPLMLATLQHLASRGDIALVRHLGDEWIAEADAGRNRLFREARDLNDRLQATGSFLARATEPMIIIRTSTVMAMARRGLFKLLGPKRRGISADARKKDYTRAELTPYATALRGELEDRTHAAYDTLLTVLRG